MSLVHNGVVLRPEDVFSRFQKFREMNGDVVVALTDYGFWDVEKNHTNNVTWSYRGGKSVSKDAGSFNELNDKLLLPIVQPIYGTDKVVQYDRIWRKEESGDRYRCMTPNGVTDWRCAIYSSEIGSSG